ncbi:hypothetical protein PS15p_205809 [Mucor circinelloides]
MNSVMSGLTLAIQLHTFKSMTSVTGTDGCFCVQSVHSSSIRLQCKDYNQRFQYELLAFYSTTDNSDNDFRPQSPMPPRARPVMLGRRDRGADEGDEQNTGRQAGRGTEPRYATNAKIPIYENRNIVDLAGEEWRLLPSPFVNFQASNLGRIMGLLKSSFCKTCL